MSEDKQSPQDLLLSFIIGVAADLSHATLIKATNTPVHSQANLSKFIEDEAQRTINDGIDEFYQIYELLVNDISDQVKKELKLELQMEFRTQMNGLRSELMSKVNTPVENESKLFRYSECLPDKNSDKLKVNTNMGDSDWRKVDFTEDFEDRPRIQLGTNKSVEELLKNNPLYNRVSTNIDRASQGKKLYTVDEFIEVKKNRMELNEEQISDLRKKYDDVSDEEYDENDPFEKIMASRFSN